MKSRDLRTRLDEAQLYLLFVPELASTSTNQGEGAGAAVESNTEEACERLLDALPHVDLVQVRPKPLGELHAVSSARACFEWTQRVLDLCASLPTDDVPLILVNDRADVAKALAHRGCAGVHLGQDDSPPEVARNWLGPDALIGLSTHNMPQVAAAALAPVDYLGFGPMHSTPTKGYTGNLVRGNLVSDSLVSDNPGSPLPINPATADPATLAWVATQSSPHPLFPIGGIRANNIADLSEVGRACVGSAILQSDSPSRAAQELRTLIGESANPRLI